MFNKVLQAIFGYDFGYIGHNKPVKIKWIVKSFHIAQCVFMTFLILRDRDYSNLVYWSWYLYYTFKYILFMLIFTFLKSDCTFCEFQNKFNEVFMTIGCYESVAALMKRVQYITIFVCFINRFLRITHVCIDSSCLTDFFDLLAINTILAGFEVISYSISFQFCSAYFGLKFFGSQLKYAALNKMQDYLSAYKSLVNVTVKYKTVYQHFYGLLFLLTIPDVMGGIYVSLWQFRFTDNINNSGSSLRGRCASYECILKILMELWSLMVTLIPALVAGTLSSETKKIGVILHNRLIAETDESNCHVLERFIRYVEARRLKFTVYTVIPLDARLLGIVFNFCVTYLIVIIQLTHVY